MTRVDAVCLLLSFVYTVTSHLFTHIVSTEKMHKDREVPNLLTTMAVF